MNFKRYHVSRNLFDTSNAVADKFISSEGDAVSGIYPEYNFSYVILNVTPNTTYRFKYEYTVSTITTVTYSGTHRRIIAYDANGNYISQIIDIQPTENYYGGGTFTTPANCYKISINYINNEKSNYDYNIMLSKGAEDLPYEPYSSEVWHDIPHYIHNTSTDTITTPADIYANDTTATVGLKGSTTQNGTPSPQNPVIPQGTGERTGNLVEGYISGCNINASGGLIFNAEFTMFIAKVEQGKTYCLDTTITVAGYFTTMPTVGSVSYDAQRTSLTLSPFTAPIDGYLAYRKASSETTAMMNEGNELLPYEPYGYKIPILNNSQTTNVYLGEVQTVRKVKKLVLTGEENWGTYTLQDSSYCAFLSVDNFLGATTSSIAAPIMCSHYEVRSQNNIYNRSSKLAVGGRTNQGLLFVDIDITSETEWKNYLAQQYAAGTPVCVWYVLATETTGIVNELIRKIGTYADEVSGITIPTIAGANTLSIGTTVQPSEVTVNYKGWHPVQSVHERDNGAWT